MTPENSPVHFLSSDHGTRIAWTGGEVEGAPTLVFLAGHGSDMNGTKALAAHEWADDNGVGFIRFDYFGHGQSSGDMMAGNLSRWTADCLAVIDQLVSDKIILIGSSLGGWLMLLVARARPGRIAGMVGIAAAPDFTDDLIWDHLTADQQAAMARDGQIALPNPYAPEDVIYPYQLITDGRKNFVLRDRQDAPYPVRLLHGMEDEEVPWETAEKLARNLNGPDVMAVLVKGAGHRFSEPEQIDILLAQLGEVTLKAQSL
ncbi:MAG: alpha/beta hydrolase [Alphaproteobacteria bacterium]|nr:alpha/beta hydrolase [Alphaproteobacteria bacterium]